MVPDRTSSLDALNILGCMGVLFAGSKIGFIFLVISTENKDVILVQYITIYLAPWIPFGLSAAPLITPHQL